MEVNRTWATIDGIEGYEFSDKGEIKCLPKRGNHYLTIITKGSFTASGKYMVCSIHQNGKRRQHKVHRLIATAFLPNELNLPTINHKDGDGRNNNVENLEWCTNKHNTNHAVENGLMKCGENVPTSKLKTFQVLEIFNSPKSQSELSKQYNISPSVVQAIKSGKSWRRITEKNKISRKLDPSIVKAIFESNLPQNKIAEQFKVSFQLVSNIKIGKSYNEITKLKERVSIKRGTFRIKIKTKKGTSLILEERHKINNDISNINLTEEIKKQLSIYESSGKIFIDEIDNSILVLSKIGAFCAAQIDILNSLPIIKKT